MTLKKNPQKDKATQKLLHETHSILRAHNPDDAESDILRKLVLLRYPDWSEDQIASFLQDIPNIDILANQIVYREAGMYKVKGRRTKTLRAGSRGGPAAEMKTEVREEKIGQVLHYYPHLGIAVIEVARGQIKEGDVVHLKGPRSDMMQEIGFMESDNHVLKEAHSGQTIGLRVEGRVQDHDIVFKVKERRGHA